MTVDALIHAQGLRKSYGSVEVLRGIDWTVPKGRVVGLLGPNGAGKSTLMKALLGLTPVQGELSVLGRVPSSDRTALMQEVAFLGDTALLPGWATAQQLIDLLAATHPKFDRTRALQDLARTSVGLSTRISKLSKGMIVQLHLALLLAIDARLLVLDEPTLGLDLLFRQQFFTRLVEDYLDEHRSVVIATHQVDEVEGLLTDVVFLRQGRVVYASSIEAMEARFMEVRVSSAQVEAAMAFKPIWTKPNLGESTMLFDGVDRSSLAALGEVHRPRLADVFVALMSGELL